MWRGVRGEKGILCEREKKKWVQARCVLVENKSTQHNSLDTPTKVCALIGGKFVGLDTDAGRHRFKLTKLALQERSPNESKTTQ